MVEFMVMLESTTFFALRMDQNQALDTLELGHWPCLTSIQGLSVETRNSKC